MTENKKIAGNNLNSGLKTQESNAKIAINSQLANSLYNTNLALFVYI